MYVHGYPKSKEVSINYLARSSSLERSTGILNNMLVDSSMTHVKLFHRSLSRHWHASRAIFRTHILLQIFFRLCSWSISLWQNINYLEQIIFKLRQGMSCSHFVGHDPLISLRTHQEKQLEDSRQSEQIKWSFRLSYCLLSESIVFKSHLQPYLKCYSPLPKFSPLCSLHSPVSIYNQ